MGSSNKHLNRRGFIKMIAATGCASVLPMTGGGCSSSAKKSRPNIVFVFADDQAPWALGTSGDPNAQTPNMDKLFSEGAYLKNAYTPTPVCSPSRASLMTSRYGSELGITDWLNPNWDKTLAGTEPDLGLDPETVTWPELLQQAGYTTGLVGKWHLGDLDKYHPTATGFDYFMGFRDGGTKTENPVLEKDGEQHQFEGLTADILADHAIEFLKNNKDKTFCLCLHHRAPHTRWLPVSDEDWAPYENYDPVIPNPDYPDLDVDRVKRMTREYLASVRSVDRNLGRVMKTLDEYGLRDNTLVIYSSDHGYNMGHNGIWHKGNGHWVLNHPTEPKENIPTNQRPNMYDNSIKIPTAVRWPGVIQPGTEIHETISIMDWYPTLLAIAGVEKPDDVMIRGRNFLPILKGENIPDWDNDFYGEYSTHHQSRTHMRMYRTDQFKLIRDFLNPWRDEFYDMINDPAETSNLIDDPRPKIQAAIAELDKKIRKRMREIDDPVLGTIKD